MARPKEGRPKGGRNGNKKHGRQLRKPSHVRYWASHRLERRKVRALVRHNGMTEHEARILWLATRRRRRS